MAKKRLVVCSVCEEVAEPRTDHCALVPLTDEDGVTIEYLVSLDVDIGGEEYLCRTCAIRLTKQLLKVLRWKRKKERH